MNDAMRAEWEKKARWWARQINKLLDANAPDCIMAHAVASLTHCALGYLGQDMAREIGNFLVDDARQRIGRCHTCDNEIPVRLTHYPYCEACQAKHTVEAFRYEVEYGDEDEGSET